MKVVVAPDKFRGSLSALEASLAMERGVLDALPSARVDRIPMADGGEGTMDALVAATAGSIHPVQVCGPLGAPVPAAFGILGDRTTAVIEMALASGHAHVPRDRRDPSITTTRGTGDLLLAALSAGARRIILGLGGSATNDAGAGLAQALGFRLLDADGNELPAGGAALLRLARIDPSSRDPRLLNLEVSVACDVDNPLSGPTGASAVYGPQKGATPEMVAQLDRALAHFAAIIKRDLGADILTTPGGGAAGGLGAGLVAFANGRLQPGVSLVINTVNLPARLAGAALCITGEGALDASSAFGKTAVGVARLARSLGCPTLALAGTIGKGAEAVLDQGINAYFSICPAPIPLAQAFARAPQLLQQATAQAVRCFLAGQKQNIEHSR